IFDAVNGALPTNSVFVDGAAGADRLTFKGGSSADTVTLSSTGVGMLSAIVATNFESATLMGNSGEDNFTVTGVTMPVTIDGGIGDEKVTVHGTSQADVMTVTPGSITGSVSITLVSVEILNVQGDGGD